MKTLMFAAALAFGTAAVAQTSPAPAPEPMPQGEMPPQSEPAQPQEQPPPQMTQGAAAIARDEAVAPPGYNANERAVPPEQAAQIISQLSAYDYPPCSRQVRDRCIQVRPR